MTLHDLLGRTVRTQDVSLDGTGKQTAQLSTRGLLPGCYLLRIQGQNGLQAARVLHVQ
jgi:hypothetical protein